MLHFAEAPSFIVTSMSALTRLVLSFAAASALLCAEEAPPAGAPAAETSPAASLEAAIQELKLPGISINSKERYVDVTAEVCLDEGALELIVCTRDSKEHEAVIVIDAKPMHIHAALLLIGAKPGSPARRIPPNEERSYWIDTPPTGGEVGVFVAFQDKEGKWTERPISDFLRRIENPEGEINPAPENAPAKFPTHRFLFAGSVLITDGEGPRRYICDESGHVISISTFGDELLCLPDVHGQENASLDWEVDPEQIPPVGTKCLLRLRPILPPVESK